MWTVREATLHIVGKTKIFLEAHKVDIRRKTAVYIYIYIYIYVCVCVCVFVFVCVCVCVCAKKGASPSALVGQYIDLQQVFHEFL